MTPLLLLLSVDNLFSRNRYLNYYIFRKGLVYINVWQPYSQRTAQYNRASCIFYIFLFSLLKAQRKKLVLHNCKMCQKKPHKIAKKMCLTLVVNSNTKNRIDILKYTISSVICYILQFCIWDAESFRESPLY